MRLWSIHPKYLDTKGLVAVWREALLAKAVLENKTKGYKNHPELNKFKKQKEPVSFINTYLRYISDEACKRKYCFNKSKIGKKTTKNKIKISKDDAVFEFNHLKKKLRIRDKERYNKLLKIKKIKLNPLFRY